jgi:uncharacterized protein YkwD
MIRTLIVTIALLASSIAAQAQTELWQKQILQKVNEIRQKGCKCGRKTYPAVPKLSWNSNLEQSANNHAVDMYKNNYFDHNSLNGASYSERIEAAGYNWKFSGENIAEGQENANEAFSDWLKSTTHCQNMMNKSFKNMGVARCKNYWVQDFGTLFPK